MQVLQSLGSRVEDVKAWPGDGLWHRCIGFCYGGRSCAMAIGIKAAGGVSGLAPGVQEALRQAGDSRCALQQAADPSIAKVVAVGIAFLGKSFVVAAKALKGGWDGQSEAG